MNQEPEKKETKNPADRFNKVNRKMTIVWTGVAVLVVLAIALGLFFASKGGTKTPEGSGSMEGTVVINDDGQKVLVDDDGNEVVNAAHSVDVGPENAVVYLDREFEISVDFAQVMRI